MSWHSANGIRTLRIEADVRPGYPVRVGRLDPALPGLQIAALMDGGKTTGVWRCDTGERVFSRELENHDPICVLPLLIGDADGDGENELVVPCHRKAGNRLLWLDAAGGTKREVWLPRGIPETLQFAEIDGLAMADLDGEGGRRLCVWISGVGIIVVARDGRIERDFTGFPAFSEHYLFAGDINNDGKDELLFSAADPRGRNGLFFAVDGQGGTLFARAVQEIGNDAHVDDLLVDDFSGDGTNNIFSATGGTMLDGAGRILWSLNDTLAHGQWCDARAARPDLGGKQLLIGELWGRNYDAVLAHCDGTVLWTSAELPRDKLALRPRFIEWGDSVHVAVAEGSRNICGLASSVCPEATTPHELFIDILDAFGQRVERIPFQDYRRPDWIYNCEQKTAAADFDGDGREELLINTGCGDFLLVGKE